MSATETGSKIFDVHEIEVDSSKIIADTEDELVVPVLITREGVVPYPEKNRVVLRSAEALRAGAFTFEHAWIVESKHPDGLYLTEPELIKGHISDVVVDESAVDPKGNKSVALRGAAHIYKKKASSNFVQGIAKGTLKAVSMGYLRDDVPQPGEWNGQKYTHIQKNIMANHIAVGVGNARVKPPFIGVGVDELTAAQPAKLDAEAVLARHRKYIK